MKIKTQGYFPYVITAESALSNAGNKYLKIGIGSSSKNKDGEYQTAWLNTISKEHLLILSEALRAAYHSIVREEFKEHAAEKHKEQIIVKAAAPVTPPPVEDRPPLDDEIPF